MIRCLISLCIAAYMPLAFAEPSVEEIENDIRAFQRFFSERFPAVSLSQYSDGVNALPQYAEHRLNWELLLTVPPYERAMIEATKSWEAELSNGVSLARCFRGNPSAGEYPNFLDGAVHTIERDINRCLEDNGEQSLDGMSEKMALLVAAFKETGSGELMDVDFRAKEIRRLYEIGREYFWAKRGQQNLSCANCHVDNAGNQLRGDVLGAALGHGTGSPAYSIAGALNNQPIVTLHQRYAQCNVRIGAVPLAAQSEAYIGLEVYQAIMNRGVPIKVPSLRP